MKTTNKNVSKRIRKDDTVLVIAGNSRGKSGKVMRILDEKVYISGVNLGKKHVKSTRTSKGGIVELERPIHISNVKVSVDGKPVKLRVRENDKGSRELFYHEGKKKTTYRPLSPVK